MTTGERDPEIPRTGDDTARTASHNRAMTTNTPPAITHDPDDSLLANVSIGLGVAGLLPILPILGSLAAIVCGAAALPASSSGDRSRAVVGISLGIVGVAGPLLALFVYCVVLGYPFPIHPYRPGS